MNDLIQQAIEEFWDTVPAVWGRVRGKARAYAINDFSITLVQFHILRYIRQGVRSASDLADQQQISRPAISQAVDLLVEKGLVARQQDSTDRRYVQLALTESGNDLINSIFAKNRQWMAQKMARLEGKELETIIRALTILKKTFHSPEE